MWGEFTTGELEHGKLHGGERRGQQEKRRRGLNRKIQEKLEGGKEGKEMLSIGTEPGRAVALSCQ